MKLFSTKVVDSFKINFTKCFLSSVKFDNGVTTETRCDKSDVLLEPKKVHQKL